VIALNRNTTTPPVDTVPSDAEFAAFHMAESLDTAESWNAFLKDHEKGELVSVAQERLKKAVTRAQQPVQVTVEQPAVPSAPPTAVAKTADATTRTKIIDTVNLSDGVYMMGNDAGKGDEKPSHQVRLQGFRITPSPISNAQYLKFLEDTGYPRPKDPAFAKNYLLGYPDSPVVNVSYDDALAFCKWVSTKFGVLARLPTEAEWEYAALHRKNVDVWEWVSDFYSKDYYSTSPVKDPTGPPTGSKRVVRGGSPTRNDTEAPIRRRGSRRPQDRSDQIGFRIILDSRANR